MSNGIRRTKMNKIRFAATISLIVIVVLAVLGIIAFEIYIWVHYGNMPKEQIPAWVWWWMLGGKR